MEPGSDTATTASGPGATLRRAREDRRLSIEEAARSLNLSPRHIGALENDQYDKLPGPTYVRGYLRGYAQLLGLSTERVLEAYNQLPVATQRAEMTAPAPVREAAGDDMLAKTGTIAVAAVVLGLALLWWSAQDDGGPDAGSATNASAPTTETGAATAAPESAVTSAKAPETISHPEVARTTSPTPAQVAAVSDASSEAPRARLVLRVREDSWADVRDAEENRLLYQTIEGGRMVSVQGIPPLSVFLGNVDGVEVEYNGQRYDALRHKRGEVARFTLDAPSAN